MTQEELQFEIHKLLDAALPQQVWRGSCAERPIEGSRPVIHGRPCLVSNYIMVVTQGNGGSFLAGLGVFRPPGVSCREQRPEFWLKNDP